MDGRTRRWQEHNDAQRRRLVEAAILLYDEGRAGASLLEIGQRAGVSRAALYRQFADRADLERAVQKHVFDDLWRLLAPALTLGDEVRTSIHTAVEAYVGWAAAHPELHRVTDLDGGPDSARERGLRRVSAALAEAVIAWFEAVGARLTDVDRAATDPLTFGVVSTANGTVRRWLELGAEVPDAPHLVELITDMIWAMIDVRLRSYGLVVDPVAPLGSQRA